MGRFSTFAISFSLISITTGIFANYGFGLQQAGPRFIWTWVIVGVGQLIIALNFAHIAPRIPLSGCAYQWAARMRNPGYGWFPGWFFLAGYLAGTVGVAYAFALYFAPYVGLGSSQGIIILVTVIVIFLYLVIHLAGIRLTSNINNVSVVTELVGIMAVGIGLFVYSIVRGLPDANVSFLTTHGASGSTAGFSAFAVSALVGAWTLMGFEGAADLAEEAKNPRISVPRAIIYAELISAVVGFVVLLGFTMAIPNLAATQANGTPLLYIMSHRLPSMVTDLAMVMVFIAIFACGLMNMAAVSRQGFSMSRDNMLPFSKQLTKVSSRRRSPYMILTVAAVICVLFTLVAQVESVITSVASVGGYAGYFMVVLAAVNDRKYPVRPGTFSLGRAAKPLAYVAMVWCVVICCALTIPSVGNAAGKASLGMFALGVIWYFYRARHVVVQGPSGTSSIQASRDAHVG
jgi:amino acid transporter